MRHQLMRKGSLKWGFRCFSSTFFKLDLATNLEISVGYVFDPGL